MNSKLNFVFVLMALVLGLILFVNSLSAQDIFPSRVIEVRGLILPVQNERNLVDKIEEAKQLLENSPPLQFKEEPQKDKKGRIIKKKGRLVMEITEKEIALAVLDTETGQVFEKRYWLNMAEINKANDLRKKYLDNPDHLPIFRPADADEEFRAVSNWWNSFNSDISVIKEGTASGRYIVAANKYLMSNDDLVYPEERTGAKYSDIVYVPHSKAIQVLMLIASGKDFINENVRQVFEELTQAGVMSRAFPGKLVTETISPTFVKNILINEHSDPKLTLISADSAKYQAERVLVRLGTNGGKAFRYTVSKTGASGLGQIMAKTYSNPNRDPNKRGALESYPSAGLIKDVDIGRVDIKNGIKATILVFDMKRSEIEAKVKTSAKAKKIWASKTLAQKEEVMAASYNGGSSKYKYLTGNISTAVTETVLFVQKFRMIRDLNLFN